MSKKTLALLPLRAALVAACFFTTGCSLTTLRCGVDKDTTYVDITNVPQDLAGNARYYAQLCGFAYSDPRLQGE